GLVKFDFLGLKTLTVIDWAIKAVNAKRQRTGEVPIDVDTLPLDDDATYEMLRTGETTALFQLESQGMKELIRKLAPDNIEDVIALVALFRPGPLQSGAVDDYIDRKHGRAPVAFAHPKLESVLESTYGVMLYQEHVMSAAQVLAGFSMGQADLLRRAMGKKKPEEMAQMREMFTGHAEAEGVDVGLANTIFDDMEKFAGYAFNKSHSAAYAMVTFQTAWLKTHHPAEFMAAVLSVDMQNIDKVVTLVDEVRRMGLELRSPDVNTGQFRFSTVGSEILYGLGAVRGVGEAPVEAIVEDREHNGAFASLHDFCLRVDARKANRRVIEALIRAGAMDCFAFDDESVDAVRARLMAELKTALHGAEQSARDAALGMDDMFGGVAVEQTRIKVAAVAPLDKRERLEGEKEALGLYLTGHPIDDYLEEIRQFCPTRISTLKVGRGRVAAGLVVSNRSRRSRRGHPMAFTVLDDRSGRIEASVFGDVLEANRDKLFKDAVLVLEGEVQPDDYSGAPGASGSSGASGALAPTGRLKLRVESILTIDEARARYAKCVEISMCADSIDAEFARILKTVLEPHRSDACRVAVSYTGEDAQGRVTLGEQWRVAPTDALLQSLRDAFGREAVAVRYG
ncbi:MAG: DNA polymerase III subunit alpha, partial [Gammaproteobacteria bacterium]|nr:DNA polymerase III subunit alpha [Gammaproteobacteria bacterium]